MHYRKYGTNIRRHRDHQSFVISKLSSRPSSALRYDPQKRNALVVGCSFTEGIGVSADENFVSQLNASITEWTFTNAGLAGGGAYSALLALREELAKRHYDLIIYAPIANHLRRENDIYYRFNKTAPAVSHVSTLISPSCAYPFTTNFPILLNEQKRGVSFQAGLRDWPGDNRLRLINFLRLAVQESQRYIKYITDSQEEEQRLAVIIRTMYTYAQLHNSKFAVTALFGFNCARENNNHLSYFSWPITAFTHRALVANEIYPDIKTWDISYPQNILDDPKLHTVPTDYDIGDHPSAIVHRYYAAQIAKHLPEMLAP